MHRRILGLDLGVASIGWAYLLADETNAENSQILHVGVRIVPLTTDENDEFTKGNAISKNRARTLKRSLRRGQHRYKLRKHLLRKALRPLGMQPDAALFALTTEELYGLRDRAARERVSRPELGRILFHLNQKRGYRDSRKGGQSEEEKESDYLGKITERHRLLQEQGLTVGQYLFRLIQEDPHVRLKQRIFYRHDYEAEFDKIWETQQPHYPDVLTPALRRHLRDHIIYYHRPLKSQKGLVGECRFERFRFTDKTTGKTREAGYKVAPRSSPLFQVCRIWQDVNKLTVFHKKVTPIALTLAQKQDLFEHLTHNPRLGKSDLLKRLGYAGRDYSVNIDSHLTGNVTRLKLAEAFEKAGVNRPDLLEFPLTVREGRFVDKETGELLYTYPIVDEACERLPHYRLWHLLHSEDQPERIAAVLHRNFGFTPEQAQVVSNVSFTQDFSNLSARAIRRLIPHLQQGLMYSEACEAAGYNHSDSLTNEQNAERVLEDRLKILPKNSLRQPVVEKIVNQTINLVNAILSDPELGRPDEIRVELARELKQNIKKRKSIQERNSILERENKAHLQTLQKEFKLNYTRAQALLKKYRLWLEQGRRSTYTGDNISFWEVVKGGGYDIDHIIPQSRLFDDSMLNLVLVEREINAAKGDLTAYEYMQSRGPGEFEAYLERVSSYDERKRKKLLTPSKGYPMPEDFINRQLVQTQYISKTVTGLLRTVCRNVTVTSGGITSFLRKTWGLEKVIQSVNFEEYRRVGRVEEVEKYDRFGEVCGTEWRIKDWSKREDHRHHAVDAIVIAATKQAMINRLNSLSQVPTGRKTLQREDFREPWPSFVADAQRAIENILVSFKAGKRVAVRSKNKQTGQVTIAPRGFLHKETVFGRILFHGGEDEFKDEYFVPLSTRFDPTLLPRVTKPYIRQLLAERLAQFGNDPKKAFKSLDQNPVWLDRDHTERLVKVPVYKPEFVVRYKLDGNFKAADAEYIVDEGVKRAVKERLAHFGNDPKKAFREENGPIWLNEAKGICVKSVRCRTGLSDLEPLHVAVGGQTLPGRMRRQYAHADPVDFVSTRNNHHVAIYRKPDGGLHEEVVSFWEALERRQQGLPIIQKTLPEHGWPLVVSIQQNEMFVFGLDREALEDAIARKDWALISKHLYRTQKIATSYYVFRRHRETKLEDDLLSREIGKFVRVQSLERMTGIKVRLDVLGRIVRVGE